MTPADAPNAFDGPLAAAKPLQDLTAEPTSNGARTRRIPPPAQSQPGAPSMIAACASKPALLGETAAAAGLANHATPLPD